MKKLTLIASTIALVVSCGAIAKLTPDQVARLGADLTPLGAEKAGNADGSIPAWEGGIQSAPAGYKPGDHHPDPFAGDKVLFTIDKSNLAQYKNMLSPGQIKLFEAYPDSYKMNVYQTRRTASYPQYVYDATKKIAGSAELVEGGNGIVNAAIGIPFPIPSNGLEAIWNHTLRFRGVAASRNGGQVAPTASGDYVTIGFDEQIMFKYSAPDATVDALQKENILFRFKQAVTTPARLAGTALLVHETMDQVKTPRQAWTYNTGQRLSLIHI